MYCSYYHVVVVRKMMWFVVGYFRSEENFVFERALDGSGTVLEFFVPPGNEQLFCKILAGLQQQGSVISYEQLENRYELTAKAQGLS